MVSTECCICDESLNSTPEINITLYANWILNKSSKNKTTLENNGITQYTYVLICVLSLSFHVVTASVGHCFLLPSSSIAWIYHNLLILSVHHLIAELLPVFGNYA